ncbi:hypothetical protein HPB49_004235 [Dermacentor silvarum]|uniref:Uncharacterized protein n=1 Tax=Dermacentor silvarum TaxID=543639 RepID=A0ACB8CPT6_DERSI|nr:hypothetical protein HPB49_004235 [Dermacentor silvarum]
MASDESMDDGSGPSNPKQAKQTRKKFVKLFRSEWLSLPEFKGWLVEHTTTEAKCKACGVTIKCAHLAASAAAACLPRTLEEMLHSIVNYVSGSAKRSAIIVEIQELFRMEKHKLLKPSNTRWLALFNCVNRLLEQWTALEHFFLAARVEDKLLSADRCLEAMRNPYNKAYLFFLRFSLKSITVFNALFQSEKVLVHTLHHESEKLIKNFLLNFVTAKQLQRKGCDVNENDPGTYVPLEQVYIGSECEEQLAVIEGDIAGKSEFRKSWVEELVLI